MELARDVGAELVGVGTAVHIGRELVVEGDEDLRGGPRRMSEGRERRPDGERSREANAP